MFADVVMESTHQRYNTPMGRSIVNTCIKHLQERIEELRQKAHEKMMSKSAIQLKLDELRDEYYKLLASDNPQKRGFRLERIIRELFELFDLDPKASFRITGEQIDGAFTQEGTDFLFEAKWQQELVRASGLDSLAGKLGRKLENTLGLFLSINGLCC